MSTRDLPATTLPDFPKLEEEVLAFWHNTHAFEKSVEIHSPDKAYVFYDGPPFATGMPHYGHLLGSTSKDVIARFWTMRGYRVERVWGWDCHGLPIENLLEGQLGIKNGKKGIEEYGIDKFNQACRTEVMRLDKEWERIIGRLGRWVDFSHNYKTMDTSYMESVWWGFTQLYEKGLIYEGKKVILYCPRCATPLSNFEIAMDNSYVDVTEPASTYKYPVVGQTQTFLLAWSTTPWNKLATPALAVNPELTYVFAMQGDETYILAETKLGVLSDQGEYQIVKKMIGQELTKLQFTPHYDFYASTRKSTEKVGIIIADDFVTAEEGTGIVTLAIYGEDDYRVMKQHAIQLVEHVDSEGKLKDEVKPWAGQDILAVNNLVDEDLAKHNLIYQTKPHTHSVPVCYRCATRLYNAPLPAWFIDVQKLKPQLIEQNETINWYPGHLKHGRFLKGIQNAPDWNISRSRYWGTPMPVWRGTDKNGQTITRIIGSIDELKKWAVDPIQVAQLTDIHREFVDDVTIYVDDDKQITGKRIPEVLDCWVESGSMPFASLHYPFTNQKKFEANYPAQFISEYIAQTRAWFYTMHVMSVGIFSQAAVQNTLTTGTIMAHDGNKMSKSKKNFPDPMVLIDKYGVDSLRLYLMSSPVMKSENINFDEKEVADIRRNIFVVWWNTLSFYRQFADTTAGVTAPTQPISHVMDRWLISQVKGMIQQVTLAYEKYDLVKASRILMSFVTQLSTWYLRLSRDRIKSDHNNQSSQVFGYALYTLAQLISPLAPFFGELVHHLMVNEKTSVHHTDWPTFNNKLIDQNLDLQMAEVRKAVEMLHSERKVKNLKVRQPLAKAEVLSGVDLNIVGLTEILQQELNIKQVDWRKGDTLSVQLDDRLTPDLIAEGEAREIIRSIQNLRKKNGLQAQDRAEVTLPNWPTDWQDKIEQKTNTVLVRGETWAINLLN